MFGHSNILFLADYVGSDKAKKKTDVRLSLLYAKEARAIDIAAQLHCCKNCEDKNDCKRRARLIDKLGKQIIDDRK